MFFFVSIHTAYSLERIRKSPVLLLNQVTELFFGTYIVFLFIAFNNLDAFFTLITVYLLKNLVVESNYPIMAHYRLTRVLRF